MPTLKHNVSSDTKKKKYTPFFFFLSLLTPFLFSLFILLRRSRYFFVDDKISDAIPKAFDIGRILRQGEIPWLSTNIMNGGAYAIEYQYAVFNPVRLLIDFTLPSFDNYAVAAWFVAVVYLVLVGGAGFILGRNLGLRNSEALTLSTVIALGFYSIYWNASSWLVTFAGFCWLVYGFAFLAGIAHGDKVRLNLIALFLTYYLCLTAGRPAAVVALAVASIIVLIHLFFIRKNYSRGYALLAVGIAASLCASPALLPLFSVTEIGTRSASISNHYNFLVAPLDGLIAFSDPTYYAFFKDWGGYRLQKAPSFYTAWFLLPLLCIIDFSLQKLKESGAWLWLALTLIFAIAAMGPEHSGFMRFPLRYVPYFQLCLTVLLLFSLKVCGFKITRGRIWLLSLLLLFQCIHSMQSNPSGAGITLLTTLAIAGLSATLLYRLKMRLDLGIFLYLSSLIILVVLFLIHKDGRGRDRGFPDNASLTAPLGKEKGNYTLYYGGYVNSNAKPNPHLEYRIASTGMLAGDRTINGYTPVGHKGFRSILKIDDHGNFRHKSKIAKNLFLQDTHTGLTHAELMRVDRIIARTGHRSRDTEKYLADNFTRVRKTKHTRIFDYDGSYSLPGLISWVSDKTQIAIASGCQFKHSRECIQLIQTPAQGGEIIFARLWFPGYKAYLDDQEIEVSAYKNFWVKVDLPNSAQGKLTLQYSPPGLELGLWLASLGALLFIGTLVFFNRVGKPKQAGAKY